MPFWKPKFKLAGRVFAILRRWRPTIDKEELEQTNGLAGDDHAGLLPRPPLTSMIGLMSTDSTHADPTPAHLDTSATDASLSDSITSESEDPVHQARNNQKYVPACSY
jgi:hypothetical protein